MAPHIIPGDPVEMEKDRDMMWNHTSLEIEKERGKGETERGKEETERGKEEMGRGKEEKERGTEEKENGTEPVKGGEIETWTELGKE